ncbi:MAG TPA: hypothetical protein VML75_15545 [Kofleriaceae bacterium]|nr:hypothetical protein [Kofleriaceae bacterium]
MMRTSLFLAAVLASFASAACTKSDAGSNEKLEKLTERVEKLEAEQKSFAEAADFLRPIMAQQQAKEEEQAAREPDPEARFAVDVSGNAYEGPAGAAVTIVEAFDFA